MISRRALVTGSAIGAFAATPARAGASAHQETTRALAAERLAMQSEQVAKAEATRIQQWDQKDLAKPPVFFRVTKIYIEGEDAKEGPPKDATPKVPSLAEKAQSAVETAKDVVAKAEPVKEKIDEAKEGYDRAKWAAEFLADPKAALEKKVEEWEKKAEKDARKLGDTLKEYGDNVADAYKRAKDLKDDMLKMDRLMN